MEKLKPRKKSSSQNLQFCTLAGKKLVLAPVIGEDGKFERFVLIDRRDPIPVHNADQQDVYLRA
jgi:hypothetical protein